ncbi:MAG: hypothetical protein HWN67_18370, partial [Candidatus Helarchaeota archaeon]|nr:hypothetical protein [Candidatus Helarchaeota archaeon]
MNVSGKVGELMILKLISASGHDVKIIYLMLFQWREPLFYYSNSNYELVKENIYNSKYFFLFSLFIINIIFPAMVLAQMYPPEIDPPDKPFSYFSCPTDVIGVKDGVEGTEITPEGYLYTGYAELIFYVGESTIPFKQRIKTLEKGYLPIIHYTMIHNNIAYSIEVFGATLTGNPEDNLINFIRVVIESLDNQKRAAQFMVGVRYSDLPNLHRFSRAYPNINSISFNPDWTYSMTNQYVARDGKILYFFKSILSQNPKRYWLIGVPYKNEHSTRELPEPNPNVPVGLVEYEYYLLPGEKQVLEFRMPYFPIDEGATIADAVQNASHEVYREITINNWENVLASGMQIRISEPKVVNTFKASLIYNLIARDKVNDDYIQKVNEFQYDNFYLRDISFIANDYNVTGYPDFANQVIRHSLKYQGEDGNFLTHPDQFDGFGQTLWSFGQHVAITGDLNFAREVFPSVTKAIEWLHNVRQSDPIGLISTATPNDNEYVSGHVTGHNLW